MKGFYTGVGRSKGNTLELATAGNPYHPGLKTQRDGVGASC